MRTGLGKVSFAGAIAAFVCLFPWTLAAQDAMTIGNGAQCLTGAAGTTVVVPLYIRDVGGTPLGGDQARHIDAFSLRVTPSPVSAVAVAWGQLSITFARAGITANSPPATESRPLTATSASYLLQYTPGSPPLAFVVNAAAPGNQVATLSVTLAPGLASGTVINLIGDPSVTTTSLSNGAGTWLEYVTSGTLAVTNGCIRVP